MCSHVRRFPSQERAAKGVGTNFRLSGVMPSQPPTSAVNEVAFAHEQREDYVVTVKLCGSPRPPLFRPVLVTAQSSLAPPAPEPVFNKDHIERFKVRHVRAWCHSGCKQCRVGMGGGGMVWLLSSVCVVCTHCALLRIRCRLR